MTRPVVPQEESGNQGRTEAGAIRAAVAMALLSGGLLPIGSTHAAALADKPAAQERAPDLDEAARTLRSGDAAHAAVLYEILADQGESLEAELGLVRSLLQAGEFRKAASFANLTAGEHPESAVAQALLAFVNDRSGRTEPALHSLATLEAAQPREWLPVAVHAEILIDRLAPAQAVALIQTWSARTGTRSLPAELSRLFRRAQFADRMAKLTAATAKPNGAAVTQVQAPNERDASWLATSFQELPLGGHSVVTAGNGIVIDGGRSVLTYTRGSLARTSVILVRNGLGEVRAALVEGRSGSSPLVRLRLNEPFAANRSLPKDQVGPPEGVRFCFALGFSTPASPDRAYPAIAPGLVFRADVGMDGLMQITSALGSGLDGAPVFDARGKLIGLALGTGDHEIAGTHIRDRLGPGAFALRVDQALTGVAYKAPLVRAPAGKQPPMPSTEELFERLLPLVVQVVALR